MEKCPREHKTAVTSETSEDYAACPAKGARQPVRSWSPFFSSFFCSLDFSSHWQCHGTFQCPHRLSSDELLRVAVPGQLRGSSHAWRLLRRFRNASTHVENLFTERQVRHCQRAVQHGHQARCLPVVAPGPVPGIHVLEDVLDFSVSEHFGVEVEMSFYACTRHRHQSRSRRFEATPILRS